MQRREPLIYGGRLTSVDLVGEPDLLELRGGGYISGDIKSASAFSKGSNTSRTGLRRCCG